MAEAVLVQVIFQSSKLPLACLLPLKYSTVIGRDSELPPIAKSENPVIPVLDNIGVVFDPVVGT